MINVILIDHCCCCPTACHIIDMNKRKAHIMFSNAKKKSITFHSCRVVNRKFHVFISFFGRNYPHCWLPAGRLGWCRVNARGVGSSWEAFLIGVSASAEQGTDSEPLKDAERIARETPAVDVKFPPERHSCTRTNIKKQQHLFFWREDLSEGSGIKTGKLPIWAHWFWFVGLKSKTRDARYLRSYNSTTTTTGI